MMKLVSPGSGSNDNLFVLNASTAISISSPPESSSTAEKHLDCDQDESSIVTILTALEKKELTVLNMCLALNDMVLICFKGDHLHEVLVFLLLKIEGSFIIFSSGSPYGLSRSSYYFYKDSEFAKSPSYRLYVYICAIKCCINGFLGEIGR